MAKTNIELVHWLAIENSFKEGQCVPFLGPGVNAPYDGYVGFPSSQEIAFALLKDLINLPQAEIDRLSAFTIHEALQPFKDLTRFGINDLARVAVRYQSKGGQSLLIKRLRQLRNDENQAPSNLLTLIAQHPPKMIVTANFDRLMEKALEHQCMVLTLPDIEQGVISRSTMRERLSNHYQRGKGPILYKFCGSYANGSKAPAPAQTNRNDESQLALQQQNHLFDNMVRSFSQSDLQTLMFRLGNNPAYEDIAGNTRDAKIRELIIKFEQLQRIPDLIEKLNEIRPQVTWDILNDRQNQQPGTSNSEQIVVSEEDFFSILTNAGNEEARPIFQQLQSYLQRSNLLLFLGFRLESWEFRLMFKTLVENQAAAVGERLLIAIQKDPSDFWVEFWTKKGVECYDVDPAVFAQQLEQRLSNG